MEVKEKAPLTSSHMTSQNNDPHTILLSVGVCCWCDTKLQDVFSLEAGQLPRREALSTFRDELRHSTYCWCNNVSSTKPP
jgi:hypothetical protein